MAGTKNQAPSGMLPAAKIEAASIRRIRALALLPPPCSTLRSPGGGDSFLKDRAKGSQWPGKCCQKTPRRQASNGQRERRLCHRRGSVCSQRALQEVQWGCTEQDAARKGEKDLLSLEPSQRASQDCLPHILLRLFRGRWSQRRSNPASLQAPEKKIQKRSPATTFPGRTGRLTAR